MADLAEASELLVLQGVRLAGVADRDAILDRSFVSEREVDRILSTAMATNLVERFVFGETSGWIITDAGSARLARLLADEVTRYSAASVLEATVTAFEVVNDQFVGLVSRWQLESTSSTGGADTSEQRAVDELLRSLASIGTHLRETLAELVRALPRFGRYPAQDAAALDRAGTEGLRWITGVGLLSCHVVWAELHQDLLSTLGRDRLGYRQNG